METETLYLYTRRKEARNDVRNLTGRVLEETTAEDGLANHHGERYLAIRWTGIGVAFYRLIDERTAGGGVGRVVHVEPIFRGVAR